jgi:phosphatidylserine/phosphatidylglycerophosphate/cardiolipin synthase-like enzyme
MRAIQKAKKSIDLVMFGLNDPVILQTLGLRNDIEMNVYYDAAESPHVRSQLPAARLHPMHLSGLMHQKILIVDKETVFIGSANMTESSLLMHDNLMIGLNSTGAANFLLQKIPSEPGYFQTMADGQLVEIWLLPDPRGNALTDLRRYLRQARSSLQVALFTLTHPILCDDLIAAKKRGVDVVVVIDLHSGLGASAKAAARLYQHNIDVRFSQGVQLLHHKFVWIDKRLLICGSANWTKAAFEKNSDCLLALHSMAGEQKKFMSRLWRRIETESASFHDVVRGQIDGTDSSKKCTKSS